MIDKDKLARKIEFKQQSNMDVSKDIGKAVAMSLGDMDEEREIRVKKKLSRYNEYKQSLPKTEDTYTLIKIKLDVIKDIYQKLRDSYTQGRYSLWKDEPDFLDILGYDVLWDSANICDTANPSFDTAKTRGNLLDIENANMETYMSLFPDYLKCAYDALIVGGEKLYLELGNLSSLTTYGAAAACEYSKGEK